MLHSHRTTWLLSIHKNQTPIILYPDYGYNLSASITNADLPHSWPRESAHLLPLLSLSWPLLSCWVHTTCPYLQTFDYSFLSRPIVFYLLLKDQLLPLISQWCQSLCLFFSKFSFTSVVLCSSLLRRMLRKHLDSCISTGPPDPSLKLFLAVMPTEDFRCAKSFVPLADKAVSLYTLSIYGPHLNLCFLWAKSCLFVLSLCNISHNGTVICSGNSSAFNGKYNKHY